MKCRNKSEEHKECKNKKEYPRHYLLGMERILKSMNAAPLAKFFLILFRHIYLYIWLDYLRILPSPLKSSVLSNKIKSHCIVQNFVYLLL